MSVDRPYCIFHVRVGVDDPSTYQLGSVVATHTSRIRAGARGLAFLLSSNTSKLISGVSSS